MNTIIIIIILLSLISSSCHYYPHYNHPTPPHHHHHHLCNYYYHYHHHHHHLHHHHYHCYYYCYCLISISIFFNYYWCHHRNEESKFYFNFFAKAGPVLTKKICFSTKSSFSLTWVLVHWLPPKSPWQYSMVSAPILAAVFAGFSVHVGCAWVTENHIGIPMKAPPCVRRSHIIQTLYSGRLNVAL